MNLPTIVKWRQLDRALAILNRALIWVGGIGLTAIWLASLGHALLSIR